MPGGRLQDPQDRIDRKRDELGVKVAEHGWPEPAWLGEAEDA